MTSWCDLGVTFDLASAIMFSTAKFETCFSYHKAIWIAVTDNHIYCSQIVLSPLTTIDKIISHLLLHHLQLCIHAFSHS